MIPVADRHPNVQFLVGLMRHYAQHLRLVTTKLEIALLENPDDCQRINHICQSFAQAIPPLWGAIERYTTTKDIVGIA